jgi:hypothetical protein
LTLRSDLVFMHHLYGVFVRFSCITDQRHIDIENTFRFTQLRNEIELISQKQKN